MVDSTNNRKRKDVTGRGRCNNRGVLDTIGCAGEKTKDLRILLSIWRLRKLGVLLKNIYSQYY